MTTERILCTCGCGGKLLRYDGRGRERRYINGHNGRRYAGESRPCTKCGVVKPLGQFVKRPRGRHSWCRECVSEYDRRRYQKIKERRKAQAIEWNRANVERKRLYNRERAAGCREEIRERARKWARENPDKRKAHYHKREARKRGNGGSFTAEEWQALCARHDNRCVKCGDDGPLQADHVVPLALGGSSNISNIQPLCGPCNFHKHLDTTDYR